MIKVVHLTSVHRPNDVRIFYKECKALLNSGYEVVLVAPNDEDEIIDDILIRAVPQPRNRLERMVRTVWAVYRESIKEDADLYHFHDPELIPICLLLKIRGKKVVYDVHEDLPRQIMNKHWIPSWIRKVTSWIAKMFETIGSYYFNGIIGATPTIVQKFPRDKTILICNYPIMKEWTGAVNIPYDQRSNSVAYVGVISATRGARKMVEALDFVSEKLNIRLEIAGNVSPANFEKELRAFSGWKKVDYLGWQSREGVVNMLSRARVGLVMLHPTPSYLDAYPVKMFEYMLAGIPVIASNFPLWRKIVEGADCGLLVNPLEPKAIAEAIEWLLTHQERAEEMGRNGREAVCKEYNWENEEEKLLNFYDDIIIRA